MIRGERAGAKVLLSSHEFAAGVHDYANQQVFACVSVAPMRSLSFLFYSNSGPGKRDHSQNISPSFLSFRTVRLMRQREASDRSAR